MEKKYEYVYENDEVVGIKANNHTYYFYYCDGLELWEDDEPIEYFNEDIFEWEEIEKYLICPKERLTLKEAMKISDHILPKQLMNLDLYINERIKSVTRINDRVENINEKKMFFTKNALQKYFNSIVKHNNNRLLGIYTSEYFDGYVNNKNEVFTNGRIFIVFEDNMSITINYMRINETEVEYKELSEYEIRDFFQIEFVSEMFKEFRNSLLYDPISKKVQEGFNYSFIKNIEVKGFKSSYKDSDIELSEGKASYIEIERIGTKENFCEICINLDNGVSISIEPSLEDGCIDVWLNDNNKSLD